MRNNKSGNCILYYKNKIPILNKRLMNSFIKNNQKKNFFTFDNVLIIFILSFIICSIIYLYFKKQYV